MGLRRKLLTSYTALALLAMVIAGISLWAIVRWEGQSERLDEHYMRSLVLDRIRAETYRAMVEIPEAIGGEDPDARTEFEAALSTNEEDFRIWSDLATTVEERQQVTDVRAVYDELVAESTQVFDLLAQGRRDEAIQLAETEVEGETFERFEQRTNEAVESDRAVRRVVRGETENTKQTTRVVITGAAFGVISVTFLIAAYLASDLFGPLRDLRQAMNAAARGDFGQRLDEERKDELGEVNRAFNRAMDSVQRRQRITESLGPDSPDLPGEPPDPTNGVEPGGDGEVDWRNTPSRVILHALTGQLRARVSHLGEHLRNDDGPVAAEQRLLVTELDQLSQAVTRLADFSFPLDLNLARTDIRALLYDILLRFQDDLARRAISLELQIDPNVTEAVIDRLKVREVIGELVRNSMEALPEEGGNLGLRSFTSDDGMQLVIEVADNGNGLDPSLINDLFAPFESGRANHAGVGLSLTKAVVEQHGGRLNLNSQPGKGTNARITFPTRD